MAEGAGVVEKAVQATVATCTKHQMYTKVGNQSFKGIAGRVCVITWNLARCPGGTALCLHTLGLQGVQLIKRQCEATEIN